MNADKKKLVYRKVFWNTSAKSADQDRKKSADDADERR
jgi:hypothetical protein